MILKSKKTLVAALALVALFLVFGAFSCSSDNVIERTPAAALEALQDGNARFVAGESVHPRSDAERLGQAGSENQGDHAYATVLACSDSRVPVERLFDAGVMDVFVVRVAGNVVQGDEAGSIEYGLAHVNTPVLVVLGHTQCGAVNAVTAALEGHGHALERNIPGLVAPIVPAVQKAMSDHPDKHGAELVPYGIENNVWQNIRNLFMVSPATRELVKSGKTKVVGAIYDVSTGKVSWLPEERVAALLAEVEADPARAMNAMAETEKAEAAPAAEAVATEEAAPAAEVVTEEVVVEVVEVEEIVEVAPAAEEQTEAVVAPVVQEEQAEVADTPCPGMMKPVDTNAIHAEAALEQAKRAAAAAEKAAAAAQEAAQAAQAAALAAEAAKIQ